MELIVVGRPNGLIEVDLMEGNWDGVILRQYKSIVLSWRLKGFSEGESGVRRRLRLSTWHFWERIRELLKRKCTTCLGKRNRKGLGIGSF